MFSIYLNNKAPIISLKSHISKQSNVSSASSSRLHFDLTSLRLNWLMKYNLVLFSLVCFLPGQTCCPAGTSQDEPSASAAAAAASWTHTWRRPARPAACWCPSARLSAKKYIFNMSVNLHLFGFCHFPFLSLMLLHSHVSGVQFSFTGIH